MAELEDAVSRQRQSWWYVHPFYSTCHPEGDFQGDFQVYDIPLEARSWAMTQHLLRLSSRASHLCRCQKRYQPEHCFLQYLFLQIPSF